MAIRILFLDKSFDFVGGNCGEAGGRPFYEPRFDRRPGEGGRLLCCIYRSVSPSSLSFSLFLEQKRRYSSFPPQMTPSHFLSHRPYHCHRFSRHLILCPTFPIISCSGIASIGLMNHKHGFFFWLSCFSWVGTKNCDIEYWVVFRSCLGSGQNLWQKRGPTPKCHPRQFFPRHLQDQSRHKHQPSLWSGFEEALYIIGQLILNLANLHLSRLFT